MEELQKMTDNTTYDFISVEQLASTLQISKGSAYALLKKGEIKNFRIGFHYKILATAVDDYIRKMSELPVPQ